MEEERLKLSEDNVFNNMLKSDFLKMLHEMDIKFAPGEGKIIYQDFESNGINLLAKYGADSVVLSTL